MVTESGAGVVEEDVDVGEGLRDGFVEGADGGEVAHVCLVEFESRLAGDGGAGAWVKCRRGSFDLGA